MIKRDQAELMSMINPRLVTTLQALRHVYGVVGSLLYMDDERLVAADLVPQRAPVTLELAARALANLASAFASSGECLELITIAYDNYQLHISGVGNASLVVASTHACSVQTLTPVVEAVLRELSRMPELGLQVPAEQAQRLRLTAAYQQPPLDPAARLYRGRRITE
jgi:hypothetical protein